MFRSIKRQATAMVSAVLLVLVPHTTLAQMAAAPSADSAQLMIAQAIAHPIFMVGYVIFLFLIAGSIFFRSRRVYASERKTAKSLIDMLQQEGPPDEKLVKLNRYLDARINTVEACINNPADPALQREVKKSSVRRAAGALLGVVAATPSTRHLQDGLRPSETFLRGELKRTLPRPGDDTDFVVRLGLLGTFIGLIAALTIATGAVQRGSDTSLLLDAIQQLLRTAAAKFWISAFALLIAVGLRLWQRHLDKQLDNLAHELGHSFDAALSKPEIAKSWSLAVDAGLAPIAKQLQDVSFQIGNAISYWTTSIPEFVKIISNTVRESQKQLRLEVGVEALQPLGEHIYTSVAAVAKSISAAPLNIDLNNHLRDIVEELTKTLAMLHSAANFSRQKDDEIIATIVNAGNTLIGQPLNQELKDRLADLQKLMFESGETLKQTLMQQERTFELLKMPRRPVPTTHTQADKKPRKSTASSGT